MKRRNFLVLTPAALGAAAMPAGAAFASATEELTFAEAFKSLAMISNTLIAQYKENMDFNILRNTSMFECTIAMMNRYPRFFHPDFIMTGPKAQIQDQTVFAMTRALKESNPIEFAQDLKATIGVEAAKKQLFDTVCAELANEWDQIESKGYKVCPYIPLDYMFAISPDSFQPMLGYKTRYGVIAMEKKKDA
jgi:hypothetical protein